MAKRRVLIEALEDRRLLAVFSVTTLTDEAFAGSGATETSESTDGNGLSLREAIGLANLNEGGAGQGDPDGDTITFASGLTAGTIDLTLGQLSVTDDLMIDGSAGVSSSRITIDADGNSRIFDVNTSVVAGTISTVAFSELIVTNGNAASENGGGIRAVDSPITLNDVDITFSTAVAGGGLSVFGGSLSGTGGTISGNSATLEGGGLWNGTGTVHIDGTIIDSNTASGAAADDGGGGIFNNGGTVRLGGLLPVSMISVTSNVADGTLGSGGGIFNNAGGTLEIIGATITGNAAERAGGGIEDASGSTGLGVVLEASVLNNNVARGTDVTALGNGGGLHITGDGIVDIVDGSVTGNTAAEEGGGLWNSAAGTLMIDGTSIVNNTANAGNNAGNDQGGGGVFNNGGALDIDNATIIANMAVSNSGNGGGVMTVGGTVTIVATAIGGNHAARAGGGIENNSGTLTLTGVSVSGASPSEGNTAGVNGGGVHVSGTGTTNISGGAIMNNSAGQEGGGLWNNSGTMTINGGSISANTASGDAADQGGGGIFNNGGTVDINQSDISGNVADGLAGSGGGILNDGGMLTITASFIDDNSAVRAGGGIEVTTANARDSIAILTDVELLSNIVGGSPGNGGGIHVSDPIGDNTSTFEIIEGSVEFNSAANEGGGLWNDAGGTMTIDGTTIDGNTASGDNADDGGGGIFNNGGTVSLLNTAQVTNNIADGVLGSGGGILNLGTLTIDNTGIVITDNQAERAGGGIEHASAATLTLTNVALDFNFAMGTGSTAPGNGGGLHITGAANSDITGGSVIGNSATLEGGGLWNGSGTMTIDGTTIDGNTASGNAADDGGGGIFNNGGALEIGRTVPVEVINNVANGDSGSGGGIFNSAGGTVFAYTGTLVSGNSANRAGGGIEDASDIDGLAVALANVTLSANVATGLGNGPGNGGGLHVTGGSDTRIIGGSISANRAALEGGGLWNGSGTMGIDGTTISGNTASGGAADDGGGGIFNHGGSLEIGLVSPVDVFDNVADGDLGSGGGIFNNTGGEVSVIGGTIRDNTANRAGGGIEDNSGAGLGVRLTDLELSSNVASGTGSGPGNGGGLHVTGPGDVLVIGGTIADNTAALEGGGLWNGSGTMTINETSIESNTASGVSTGGGGIFNTGGTVSLESVSITNNVADGLSGSGGGVFNANSATLLVVDSTISGNTADNDGGGINDSSDGSLSVSNSTIADNTAANGGGLFRQSVAISELVNSTFSGNSASNNGGAIVNDNGTLSVINSTIVGNRSDADGDDIGSGGGIWTSDGTLTFTYLFNTIVAGNVTGASGADTSNDIDEKTVESESANNLIGDPATAGGLTEGTTGNRIGDGAGGLLPLDQILDPLADNGGPTLTHALLPDSRAIDGGDNSFSTTAGDDGLPGTGDANETPILGDQRGAPLDRIEGPLVDIGAYELQIFDASSLIVNTSLDALDFNQSEISLREAILAATTHIGADTITFDPSVTISNLSNLGELEIEGSEAMTIQGNGADQTRIDGNGFSRIFNLTGDGDVTFDGVTLTGGSTSGNGGAINSSGFGLITIRRSTISGNSSQSTRSNPSIGNDDYGYGGGGIFTKSRTLVVIDSTISGNSSAADGGGINSAYYADVTLINSTVSGNTAGAQGGGLYFDDGAARVINSTITNNTSSGAGGGIGNFADDSGERLTIHNSIIAGNTDDDSAPDFVAPGDPELNLEVLASLIGDNTGTTLAESTTPDAATGSIIGDPALGGVIDPLLSPLQDNGGPTLTHAPLAASPSVDAGDNALLPPDVDDLDGDNDTSEPIPFDQRGDGFVRIVNGDLIETAIVDMGAVELQLNQQPSFTATDPPAVDEDSGAQTFNGFVSNFDPGDPSESSQTVLGYIVSNITNPTLFNTPPAVNTSGNLTFTAADNAFGSSEFTVVVQDSGGTANGGVDTSDPQVFTITVDGINDAPSFTASDPAAVLEDAGLQTVTGFATFDPGNTSESNQTVMAYTVSDITNAALFRVPPAIDTSGNLTYTPADNAFGTSEFTVVVQDNGGASKGGVDTSAPQVLTITVNGVNDAPTFTANNPPTVAPDAGAQTVTGFATFNPGNASESSQMVLAYTVSGVTNSALFSVPPAIDTSGNLTYTPAAGAVGSSGFMVTVQDDGGTADGGADTSARQTFTITISPTPNAQPTFTASNPPAVDQDSGAQTVTGFATFDPGDPSEASQMVLAYTVSTVTNAALFSAGPSIDTSGNLTYTPAAGVFGTSDFTVNVQDDGGTADGGVDTSAPQTFTITINEVVANNFALNPTGNGDPNPFQDGIIIVRFMLDQPDENLEAGLLIPADATRTTGAELSAFLESTGNALDANGDGDINPFEDGILIVRFLLDQPDENLEDPILIPDGSTRTTGAEISAYLETLLPPPANGALPQSNGSGEGESIEAAIVNRSDVNRDGSVTMLDALNVINQVSRSSQDDAEGNLRFDANQDGGVTTADALYVINRLAEDVTAAHRAEVDDEIEGELVVDQLLADDSFLSRLF